MKIASAEFVKSAFEKRHWPGDGLPEVAFLGRSNVGKSSLLNSLLQRKGLARTSNTPGRTQSINFFEVVSCRLSVVRKTVDSSQSPVVREEGSGLTTDNRQLTTDNRQLTTAPTAFYFVDLPGYGFAKVSKSMRASWGKMAEEYLSEREELVLSVHLVDARHKPTELDRQLHEWLEFSNKPYIIVGTKIDKLSNNELQKQLKEIAKTLPGGDLIPYSSVTGKGRDAVWGKIVTELQSYRVTEL